MEIPQIKISQQYAKIEISTQSARQEIKQKQADLHIKQPRGKLMMKHRDVKVKINNYPSRYDLGYKNNFDFIRENAKLTKKTVMTEIAKKARQGDELMKIENKGNALQKVIKEDFTPDEKEIGLKWIRGPKFKVVSPDLKINFKSYDTQINVKINPPQYKFHRGEVNIRMAQYGEV